MIYKRSIIISNNNIYCSCVRKKNVYIEASGRLDGTSALHIFSTKSVNSCNVIVGRPLSAAREAPAQAMKPIHPKIGSERKHPWQKQE